MQLSKFFAKTKMLYLMWSLLLGGCNYTLIDGNQQSLKERLSASSLLGCEPISPAFKATKNKRSVLFYGSAHSGFSSMKDATLQFSKVYLPQSKYLYTETGVDVGVSHPDFINKNNTLQRAADLLSDSPEHLAEWRKIYGDRFDSVSIADMFLALIANDTLIIPDEKMPEATQFGPNFGVDFVLIDEAKRLKIPLRPLETIEIPEIISEFSDDDLKKYSEKMWSTHSRLALGELNKNNYSGITISPSEMVSIWQTGNFDRLANIIEANEVLEVGKSGKPLKKIFNETRNKKMVEKIDTEIANADYAPVVVVGMYHLAGKNGLLSLLKDRGYTITCQ
jgi:uncharacterized protein YbaP (TraB family)